MPRPRHCARAALAAACCCVALCVPTAEAKRVINLITPQAHSHLMGMKKQTAELANRGHDVLYVVTDTDAHRLQPTNSSIITYQLPPVKGLRVTSRTSKADFFDIWFTASESACQALMANTTLLQVLQDFDADVMLAENIFFCSSVLASRLDLPWINYYPAAPLEPFMTSLHPGSGYARRLFLPNPISYHPQWTFRVTTQRMSFVQRLQNFYHFWAEQLYDYCYHRPRIAKLYKALRFDVTRPEEQDRLVLSLAPIDPAIEWYRPMAPNFKMVGALLAEPGKPLPPAVEEFMRTSVGGRGVLVVSLGTIAELGAKERRLLAAAFAQLPCQVLWRLSPNEVPDAAALADLHLGNNTKVMTWLPLNDVLADPRTRAFMNHAGVNSMYEALYHGKAILAMPFFVDQHTNADKIVAKGAGLQVTTRDIGKPTLLAALLEVLENPRFKQNAKAISVRLRARKRTPAQEAADWIEHVIDTGGVPYLKSPEMDMSFVVRQSLDVYGFAMLCAWLLLRLLWEGVRVACNQLDASWKPRLVHALREASSLKNGHILNGSKGKCL